jgi:hypothetical protein
MFEVPSPALDRASDLLARNTALATRLGALGALGTAAAAALTGRGTPPADDLVEALGEAGRVFAVLRAEALAAASAAGLEAPPPERIVSTRELAAILKPLLEALEAAARRHAVARVREQARGVLDRVGALVHRDDPAFPGLHVCQKRATEVRAALAAGAHADLDVQRTTAIELTSPFVALLALLDGDPDLSDEQWAALQDTVVAAFGRPLVAAATRGRLLQR